MRMTAQAVERSDAVAAAVVRWVFPAATGLAASVGRIADAQCPSYWIDVVAVGTPAAAAAVADLHAAPVGLIETASASAAAAAE